MRGEPHGLEFPGRTPYYATRSTKQKPLCFSPPRAALKSALLRYGVRAGASYRDAASGQGRAGHLLGFPARLYFFVPRGRNAEQPFNLEVPAISMNRQPETRVNERIRVPQVRVIGDDGSQLGVLPVREALTLAQSKGLDLVEVSPTARPPVCRIMDYGKFKYEQNLRARKAKKKQHHTHLKEIKMRPKIDDHDYDFKMRHARDFLGERDKLDLPLPSLPLALAASLTSSEM